MIKEPCPVCNGVQLRYKGRVYCTNHDDLTVALQAKEILFPDVAEDLKNLLLVKLKISVPINKPITRMIRGSNKDVKRRMAVRVSLS